MTAVPFTCRLGTPLPPSRGLASGLLLCATVLLTATPLFALPSTAAAQVGAVQSDDKLDLAPDSPYRDPDLIYLEADEVINEQDSGLLIAIGEVEGRYQDRTLRADRVEYDVETGSVIARGNVVLIDASGDVQYANNIKLDDRLNAGLAVNYTARLSNGATTAARAVARDEDGEFELYTVTYTACEICEDSEKGAKRPTWRLKARRVKQDADSRSVRYRDAVLELFGVPVFYTPYLAHPDPTQDRASGLLFPRFGFSQTVGAFYNQPYYWAVDPYTEVTVTPHIYSKVNPLLELSARRKFYTGDIRAEGSFTYETIFDNNGQKLDDPALFLDPEQAEDGSEFSGHIFLDGYFRPSRQISYGYTVMLQTDDVYLNRYNLSNSFKSRGLLQNFALENTNQIFATAIGKDYRALAAVGGYQSIASIYLRDEDSGLLRLFEDNDDLFPVIAPRLSAERYFNEPILDGRLRAFGDFESVTREALGGYMRGTAGLEYSATKILPAGIEVQPFAWGRFDTYDLSSNGPTDDVADDEDFEFDRALGQVGLEVRYPFIRKGGAVDLVIEPRAQVTESFGDAKLENFTDSTGRSLFESGNSPDLDRVLLFEANKADGVDFFERGTRADVGVTLQALWGEGSGRSEVSLFGGQSYVRNPENPFNTGSGLSPEASELVGELNVKFGSFLDSETLVRYNQDTSRLSRIDSNVSLDLHLAKVSGRYYRVDTQQTGAAVLQAVNQEVSGSISTRDYKGWSLGYFFLRDLDDKINRSQRFSLRYQDDCTRFEAFYDIRDANNNVIIDDARFGIRITLATLGGVGTY